MFLGEFVGIELRDYQKKFIHDIETAFLSHQRIMAVLPTGGGKTIVFAYLAAQAVEQGKRVLVLAHREELITQAWEKLFILTPYAIGQIKAKVKPDFDCPIQIASVQTIVNRLDFCGEFDLIIVDEAHHSPAPSYQKVIDRYPVAQILGVTATPARLDGKGFKDYFDILVKGPSTADLIRQGYLSRYQMFVPPWGQIETRGLKADKLGDYSDEELRRINNISELLDGMVKTYREFARGKKGIVFAFSIAFSKEIANRYTREGIPARHLDGTTPKEERQEIIEKFRRGEIGVLSNYGLFSEGFDVPDIDFVQVARPTESVVVWLQICGRALRPHASKESALILDHANNNEIHGLPSLDRDWKLEPKAKEKAKSKKDKESSPETNEEQLQLLATDKGELLQEIVLDFDADPWEEELRLLMTQAGPSHSNQVSIRHKLRQLRAPLRVWKAYATLLGYKPGWGWYQYQEQEASYEAVSA
jgi:superfamily II DNA or RNA helicase